MEEERSTPSDDGEEQTLMNMTDENGLDMPLALQENELNDGRLEMLGDESPIDEQKLLEIEMRAAAKRQQKSPSTELSDEEMEDEDEEEEPMLQEKSKISEPEHAPLSNADGLINVGVEYQAVIENEQKLKREKEIDRDESIWKCPEEIEWEKLKKYVDEASGRYKMPVDRALFILKTHNFDIKKALEQVASRRELVDKWSTEESSLFANCYFHYGKKFKKIQVAMPHRSLCSIIQFYYETKKKTSYKMTIDAHIFENQEMDALAEEMRRADKKPAGICENCRMKADVLIMNKAMARHECRACLLYFRMMRVPRPAKTRSVAERSQQVSCPEYMRKYVLDYVELTKLADGNAVERLGLCCQSDGEDEDEECVVIYEEPLSRPSLSYIPTKPDGLGGDYDPNTCRMTRDFDNEKAVAFWDSMRKATCPAIPLIWRQKQTKAMEDYQVLTEECRRRMVHASGQLMRVNMNDVLQWRNDIKMLRERCSTNKDMSEDEDEDAKGSRSGKKRHDYNWTDEEKRDVVRCFHWYRNDFDTISEVMGTKTQEQVRTFYEMNEELILKSIERYRHAVSGKLKSIRAGS